MISGRWSLGARARRLFDCHRQGQAGSDRGAVTAARSDGGSSRLVVSKSRCNFYYV